MASKIGAVLARKIGGQVLGDFNEHFKTEDPFYYYEETRHGQKKKRKGSDYRAPGVSERDNKVLASVRKRAWRLDMGLMNCCGFRFGWSAILGIVPMLGDGLDFLLALWVIRKAEEIEGGLPPVLSAKMYFYALVDLVGGFIPFFGDIFDAIYKANTRNAWLLEDYLVKQAIVEHQGPAGVLSGDIEMGIAGAPQSQPQQTHNSGRR
ncbi:hypothetical protein VSDG_04397 [Cytospora chrysosperma]|uniref:DUF4112 domain-containing protein n=1 Tax=Cytospora chrysosperma TaxID=252740 RepID=A0A423W4J7_CYTCH|nr:hypothetical protein VSDG_04397 [Valsa sordida]